MTNSAVFKYNQSLDVLQGKHAPKDFALSFRLNAEAAAEGYKDAILAMGWFYLNGTGVPGDIQKAKEWYKKSARTGNASAMYSLGEIAYGEGDYTAAKKWFDRAKEKNHAGSRYMLGKMYWKGCGVSQDKKLARKLISEAAQEKYPLAGRVIRFISRRRKN